MNKQLFILGFGLLISSNIALAQQDIHFSQFYASPMTINPASAGAFNGNLRGSLLYRNQWSSVSEAFTTMAASIDMPVLKKMKAGMFGLGLHFYKDDAGDSQFSTTKFSLALAYHLDMSGGKGNHFISVGFQGGSIQRSIGFDNLTFNDQWNGVDFDQNITTADQFGGSSVSALDVAAGIHWFYAPTDFSRYFGGFSMYHLNSPNVAFNDEESALLKKYTFHFGAEIGKGSTTAAVTNNGFSVLPNIIYSVQGPNRYFNLGAEAKIRIKDNSKFTNYHNEMSIAIGPYLRFGDAAYIVTRFNWQGISLGVSYDFNLSDLSDATNGNGGFEVLLGYFGNFGANPSRGHSVRFK